MARAERKSGGAATTLAAKPLDQPALVDLELEFISIAEAGLGNLGFGQPTLAGSNGHLAWVLSSEQREELWRRIETESVVLSARPSQPAAGVKRESISAALNRSNIRKRRQRRVANHPAPEWQADRSVHFRPDDRIW